MVGPSDLPAGRSFVSDVLSGAEVFVRSAFIETGYNYLSALRQNLPRVALSGRRREFEISVREALAESKINLPLTELPELYRGILNKLAKEYGFEEVKNPWNK